MDALPLNALHCVLEKLDFLDLLAASSACRRLRATAAPDSALWRDMCVRRWSAGLNTALWPLPRRHQQFQAACQSSNQGQQRHLEKCEQQQPLRNQQQQHHQQHQHQQQQEQQQPNEQGANYKGLFLQDNGWAAPRLEVQQYAGASWADELVAVQPAFHPDGSTTIAVSSCKELRVLEVGSSPAAKLQVQRCAKMAGRPGAELWSSLLQLPACSAGAEGLVAAGGCHGRLALFQLPDSAGASSAATQPRATQAFPNSSIITQLHHLPSNNHLAVLHDPLAHLRPGQQRSALSVVDAASWRQLAPAMSDLLEGYELVAAAPVGGSGQQLIAGSVRLSDDQAAGWPCQRCSPSSPAAICFHKSPASTAALCVIDVRAAAPMVARYSTHHRSLYPHLEPVRDHFLLTSHAGTPVAVWDRRQMNGPVHEAQPLPRELGGRAAAGSWLALEDPQLHELPGSQALHLSATPDLLLGRADNGMCWLWDLSERLGWADGSHPGAWLSHNVRAPRLAGGSREGAAAAAAAAVGGEGDGEGLAVLEDGPETEGEHVDECDFERGPLPLGCIGAPYEVWCSNDGAAAAAAPLHWLPPAAAWVAHNRLVALGGVELEDKQRLFPAHAQGSPYPSNALVVASLAGGRR